MVKISLRLSRESEPRDNNLFNFINKILDHLTEFTDKHGRLIAPIFLELPSKEDYPDYYQIIKKPVAFSTFREKTSNSTYREFSDFEKDFNLMVHNAMTYNAVKSQVYKDALTLQSEFTRFVNEHASAYNIVIESSNDSGDVNYNELKEITSDLATHTDEYERLVAELFLELPDRKIYPDYYKEIKHPISFREIYDKIEKKVYKSKDEFEDDFMLMFNNARKYNAEGSEVYDDANYLQNLMFKLIGKPEKIQVFESDETATAAKDLLDVTQLDSTTHDGQEYKIGDYVYLSNPEDPEKHNIVQIHKIWKQNSTPEKIGFTGIWYLRSEQTLHRANHKFYPNEVFKINRFDQYTIDQVIGRCFVLNPRDFVRGLPKGFESKDVYVCECRYSIGSRNFSKIKNWDSSLPEPLKGKEVELELFEKPIEIVRVGPEDGMDDKKRKFSEDFLNGEHESKRIALEGDTPMLSASGRPVRQKSFLNANKSQDVSGSSTPNLTHGKSVPPTVYRGSAGYPGTAITGDVRVENIPDNIVSKFDTKDGKLKWFATPPVLSLKPVEVSHSLDYLLWKHKNPNHITEKSNLVDGLYMQTGDKPVEILARYDENVIFKTSGENVKKYPGLSSVIKSLMSGV